MNPLVARWRDPEGQRLAADVLRHIIRGRPLDDLRLGFVDGLVDLRGFPLRLAWQKQGGDATFTSRHDKLSDTYIRIVDRQLVGIDFSGSNFGRLLLSGCDLQNCRFDGVDCEDWHVGRSHFKACSFREANLRRAALASGKGDDSSFEGCDFTACSWSDCIIAPGSFQKCDFLDAELSKLDFGGTRFIRCRFSGKLSQVIFWSRDIMVSGFRENHDTLADVDFTNARFVEVVFRGVTLDRVKLPNDPALLLLSRYRCVLDRAASKLRGRPELWARTLLAALESELRWLGPRDLGVLRLADLTSNPAEVEQYRGVLDEAAAACADAN